MGQNQIALWTETSSDPELIAGVRAGDSAAFGVLYERHADAARKVAAQYTNAASDIDDVVSESFSRVLRALQQGDGPDLAFRAYLFTIVRRTGMDLINKGIRTRPRDDMSTFEDALGYEAASDEPAMAGFEQSLVADAFKSLPERWQAVLWYTEVEKKSPKEIAPLLGLTANGVAALSYRAREALRQAYLQQHLAGADDVDCIEVNTQLGAFVRGGLSKREAARVDNHVQLCPKCAALIAELEDVNRGMRAVIAPLILGAAGLGALQGGLPIGGAFGTGAAAAGGAGAGAGTGAGIAGAGTGGVAAGAGGAAAIVGAGVAAMLTSGGAPAPAAVGAAGAGAAGSTAGAGGAATSAIGAAAGAGTAVGAGAATGAGVAAGASVGAGAGIGGLLAGAGALLLPAAAVVGVASVAIAGAGFFGAISGDPTGDPGLPPQAQTGPVPHDDAAGDGSGSAARDGGVASESTTTPSDAATDPGDGTTDAPPSTDSHPGATRGGTSGGTSGTGAGTGTSTGTGTGDGSGTGTGDGSGTGTSTGTGTGDGTGDGTGTGTGAGAGAGTGTSGGTGTGTGSGPGDGSGAGTGTDPGTGSGSGSGDGTGTGTDPGTGSGDGTGDGPGSGDVPPAAPVALLSLAKAPLDYLEIPHTNPRLAMSLSNTGDGAADDITAQITLPAGLTFGPPPGGAAALSAFPAQRLAAYMEFATTGAFAAGDWTCTYADGNATADCLLTTLGAGGASRLELPVSVGGALAHDASTSFKVASGDQSIDYSVLTGVEQNEEDVDVVYSDEGHLAAMHVGATLMGCDQRDSSCVAVMSSAGSTTNSSANNNSWTMLALNEAGGTSNSSSSMLQLPAGAHVTYASLEWAANRYSTDAFSGPLDAARLRAPGQAQYLDITADSVSQTYDPDGRVYYQARADVTDLVDEFGSGEWSVADVALAATRKDPNSTYFGGWALTIVYADPTLANSRVALFDGSEWVSTANKADFTFSTNSRAQVTLGWTAWEGDRALIGDRIDVDGDTYAPMRWDGTRSFVGDSGNAADSTATGGLYANALGVDVKLFRPGTVPAGVHTVTVRSSGDNFLLSTLTVTIADDE